MFKRFSVFQAAEVIPHQQIVHDVIVARGNAKVKDQLTLVLWDSFHALLPEVFERGTLLDGSNPCPNEL